MMQEHEQALADAIAKLADISDGESGTNSFFNSNLILGSLECYMIESITEYNNLDCL